MTDTEQLSALETAVGSYLSTLTAIAECVGAACPDVGGPHRTRLSRLRTRLAFDTAPQAIAESAITVERELQDYSNKAANANYVAHHSVELKRTIDTLEKIVTSLAQRQEFYTARLRQFAAQMETTPYPTDSDHLADVVALQAMGLLGCVDSMNNDAQSLVLQMRDELTSVAERLANAEVTDRVTGLMNRKEMERHIEKRTSTRKDAVILIFELSGEVPEAAQDEIALQVAVRLGSYLRHQDLLCRWSDREFMVLFEGTREAAQARTDEIVPWIAAKCPLRNGQFAEIHIEAGVIPSHHLANVLT